MNDQSSIHHTLNKSFTNRNHRFQRRFISHPKLSLRVVIESFILPISFGQWYRNRKRELRCDRMANFIPFDTSWRSDEPKTLGNCTFRSSFFVVFVYRTLRTITRQVDLHFSTTFIFMFAFVLSSSTRFHLMSPNPVTFSFTSELLKQQQSSSK